MAGFLLVSLSLIPATLVGFGSLWRSRPPKYINQLYGYRTSRSMRSQETWEYAHRYVAGLMLWIGIPLWSASGLAWFVTLRRNPSGLQTLAAALTILQCICFVFLIFPTERALARRFDDQGKSRPSGPRH